MEANLWIFRCRTGRFTRSLCRWVAPPSDAGGSARVARAAPATQVETVVEAKVDAETEAEVPAEIQAEWQAEVQEEAKAHLPHCV